MIKINKQIKLEKMQYIIFYTFIILNYKSLAGGLSYLGVCAF